MKIQGFTDFSFESPGCHPGVMVFRADFKLNVDVTPLFPFINATAENALYYDKPHYIQFKLDGYRCALYPDHVSVGMVENREQAFKIFDRLVHFLNGLYERMDSVTPNHTFYRPVPVFEIFKLLPRSNCKECGFPTCMAFAAALSKGEILMEECPAFQNPEGESKIKLELMFS